jgi:hypothetical protein
MSIIIMAAYLAEMVLLISILNVVISVVEVAMSVASHDKPNAFLLFLVRFAITHYFSVSDLSVFWDDFQIDEKTCVGSWNVSNSLD